MLIKEYCDLANVTKSAISYRIKNKKPLPGIKNYVKKDKIFILTRDTRISTESIINSFRTH